MYLKYTYLLMYLTYTCNILAQYILNIPAWYMLDRDYLTRHKRPHLIAPTKVPEESVSLPSTPFLVHSSFAQLIALVDPPIGYSWDNLYDGSIWFKLLSQFLYMQPMAHFEIKLAAPTVEFKVPLLNLIADKDTRAKRHEQYYYLHFHYYEQSKTLKEDINSSQDIWKRCISKMRKIKKDFIKLEAEMGGMGALLKAGMGSWAVQVEAFVQSHSELDQMTEEEEDEAQWDGVKDSLLSEGEGEVMPDQ
ncbi:hypothetical protein C8J57DRAFT_1252519 [Mycena rebaudengoi]|nr:hypothetical protein C8J57DRAFT_1252519 [Mycena rebaudengoi]